LTCRKALCIAACLLGAALPGTTSAASEESCGPVDAFRVEGRWYLGSGAAVRPTEVGRSLGPVRRPEVSCDDVVSTRGRSVSGPPVRAFALRGFDERAAVAIRERGRLQLYSRVGSLVQVAEHPLHRRVYARRRPPRPTGCRGRAFTIVGRVRQPPTFAQVMAMSVERAAPGAPLQDGGASAFLAVVESTRVRRLRRYGVPFLRRSTPVVATAVRCRDGYGLVRTLRLQAGSR